MSPYMFPSLPPSTTTLPSCFNRSLSSQLSDLKDATDIPRHGIIGGPIIEIDRDSVHVQDPLQVHARVYHSRTEEREGGQLFRK